MNKNDLKKLIKESLLEIADERTKAPYFIKGDKMYVSIEAGDKLKTLSGVKVIEDGWFYLPLEVKYDIQGHGGQKYLAKVALKKVKLHNVAANTNEEYYRVQGVSGSFGFGGLQQATRYTMSNKQIGQILPQVKDFIDKNI